MSEQQQVHNTESEIVDQVQGFWTKNGKKLLLAVGGVIVLAAGIVGYQQLIQKPNEEKAKDALFKAESYYRKDSINLALNGDGVTPGFLKVINNYGSTKAGNLAKFYAGSCYIKLGDNGNAIKYLKEFNTDAPQVKARAFSLLADAYADSGKKEEAVDFYKKAAGAFEKDEFNSAEYLFRAALLLETMNKQKEAIEIYTTIKTKYPRTDRGFEVDKYLARLGVVTE